MLTYIRKYLILYSATPEVITESLESLGDSITTAVLLQWNKLPGELIKEDDVIAVVETDKVRPCTKI